MTEASDDTSRPLARGGRPRDETIEERVLPIVREMLVEVGWNDLSLRAVAARTGVARPTMNRRWNSKAELVLDAIFGDLSDFDRIVGLDRAGWIESVFSVSRELFDRPDFRSALPGLLSTFDQDPALARKLWNTLAKPATAAFADETDRQHPGAAEIDALAMLVIAAGAALFASVIPSEAIMTPVQQRVDQLLRSLTERTVP